MVGDGWTKFPRTEKGTEVSGHLDETDFPCEFQSHRPDLDGHPLDWGIRGGNTGDLRIRLYCVMRGKLGGRGFRDGLEQTAEEQRSSEVPIGVGQRYHVLRSMNLHEMRGKADTQPEVFELLCKFILHFNNIDQTKQNCQY